MRAFKSPYWDMRFGIYTVQVTVRQCPTAKAACDLFRAMHGVSPGTLRKVD